MIIYNALKKEFIEDVRNDELVNILYTKYKEKIGQTSESEIRSWMNSLNRMRNVVDDPSIPDNSGIAIEFNIPYTSKRVDFIISGKDDKQAYTAVIVELKQWDKVEKVPGKDGVVRTYLGGGVRETTHPSYQAYTYKKMIEDFNADIQDLKVELSPCAYLHNYIKAESNDPIEDEIYKVYTDLSPVFTSGEGKKLRDLITKHIKFGDNKETIFKIDGGRLRPSKSLQGCLSSMLKGNEEFLMIDEQKLVYEKAIEMAKKSYKDGKKRVLIVEGGPGTGKSVLAVNLLVNMTAFGAACAYVTKNAAPRNVYSVKLKGTQKQSVIKELFMGSGSFVDVEKNKFDCLFCDEAHRLNEKSGMFKNLGENQIKEIINASKFSTFFIDEHQRIHIDDAGTIDEIKKFATEQKAEVVQMELQSQFRCNGSDGFLSWVDNTLQIRKTANFDGFNDYDFNVVGSPEELLQIIKEKNQVNNKSRLVAGYCWDWIKEGKDDPSVSDINIGNFHASWNLGNTATWAIDPDSVDQIGCIHTCQGLEFDYVGVIIGNDIGITQDGKVYTDWKARAKTDNSVKGLKGMSKTDRDEANRIGDQIIRNTYRTLMTRGQKGCYVYCVDKRFADYLKSCKKEDK
ncbi:MAG: DUF2075 domain-containing protein [Clostridia bacterium]|nr:DUF2075 domain-containing protein [Clostridia bacterium]